MADLELLVEPLGAGVAHATKRLLHAARKHAWRPRRTIATALPWAVLNTTVAHDGTTWTASIPTATAVALLAPEPPPAEPQPWTSDAYPLRPATGRWQREIAEAHAEHLAHVRRLEAGAAS